MEIFDIANSIEEQFVGVGLARAVLFEALKYVQNTDIDPYILADSAPQFKSLLLIVADYMYAVEKGLNVITNDINETRKIQSRPA